MSLSSVRHSRHNESMDRLWAAPSEPADGTGASAEELHRTRLQVVHRADDLDGTLGFEFREHRAVLPNVSDRQLDVLAGHGVHERVVLCRALPGEGRGLDGGFD